MCALLATAQRGILAPLVNAIAKNFQHCRYMITQIIKLCLDSANKLHFLDTLKQGTQTLSIMSSGIIIMILSYFRAFCTRKSPFLKLMQPSTLAHMAYQCTIIKYAHIPTCTHTRMHTRARTHTHTCIRTYTDSITVLRLCDFTPHHCTFPRTCSIQATFQGNPNM